MRSVLLPHDLSSDDDLAARFAAGLAALGTRRVVLIHILEASGLEGPVILAKIDAMRERLREVARPLEDAGMRVEVRIPTGDPYREILAAASESSVDAIVSGTQAKDAMSELIVGSVSERVVRDATVPSLMARYDLLRSVAEPAGAAERFGDRVVLPTDFSACSTRALQAALELPLCELVLLHVLSDDVSSDRIVSAEENALFQLGNLADAATEKGLSVTTVVRKGDPEAQTLAEVAEREATGVIIGTRGRNVLADALLGSVAMDLLRKAPCPVMIVP